MKNETSINDRILFRFLTPFLTQLCWQKNEQLRSGGLAGRSPRQTINIEELVTRTKKCYSLI